LETRVSMASKRAPRDSNRLVDVDESTAWYAARYENCSRDISRYLGTTQATFSEICAVRFALWLNGDLSLDWTYESCTTTIVRELGPGLRFGYLLASLYIVVISTLYNGQPLLFQYGLTHKETDMRFGNFTVAIAFYLWAVDLAIVAIAHFLSRRSSALSNDPWIAQMTPFYRPMMHYLREERPALVARQPPGVKCVQTAGIAVSLCVYLAFYIFGVLSMHTMLAHMFNRKNVWFAILLGLTALMDCISTADDLTQIGSPWGIQESSPWSSRLLAIRGCWLFPASIIWLAAAVAASFPPGSCIDC